MIKGARLLYIYTSVLYCLTGQTGYPIALHTRMIVLVVITPSFYKILNVIKDVLNKSESMVLFQYTHNVILSTPHNLTTTP